MPADQVEVLAQIDSMIRASVGEFGVDLAITMDTTFQDLGMESLDIVSVAGRIQAHYGWAVNFAEFVADVGPDAVMNLRIGQMVDYVVDALSAAPSGTTVS
jgi:acyl carrier protein